MPPSPAIPWEALQESFKHAPMAAGGGSIWDRPTDSHLYPCMMAVPGGPGDSSRAAHRGSVPSPPSAPGLLQLEQNYAVPCTAPGTVRWVRCDAAQG